MKPLITLALLVSTRAIAADFVTVEQFNRGVDFSKYAVKASCEAELKAECCNVAGHDKDYETLSSGCVFIEDATKKAAKAAKKKEVQDKNAERAAAVELLKTTDFTKALSDKEIQDLLKAVRDIIIK